MAEAERKFDYENVASVYKKMKNITGTSGDAGTIAGILHKIDEDVHNSVGVENEAIFGDLGSQLLLDWENTSSDFPNFVENFNNWSALVAQSANDYAQFEQAIAAKKVENPLGLTSKGITDAYTNTGFYSNAYSSEEIEAFKSSSKMYALVGANYIDTQMTSTLKSIDFWDGFELVTDGLVIFAGIKEIGNAAKAIKTFSAYASGASVVDSTLVGDGDNLLSAAAAQAGSNAATNSKLLGFLNKTKIGGKIAKKITPIVQNLGATKHVVQLAPSSYGGAGRIIASEAAGSLGKLGIYGKIAQAATVTSVAVHFGAPVKIGDVDYTYFGQALNGTNIVVDNNGSLVYQDATGNVSPVKIYTNGTYISATVDNIEDDSVIVAGDFSGTLDQLKYVMYTGINDYNDEMSGVMEDIKQRQVVEEG